MRCGSCGSTRHSCDRVSCPARCRELLERGEQLTERFPELVTERCPTCRRPLVQVDEGLACPGAYCTWRQR